MHEGCYVAGHSIEKTAVFRHAHHLLRQKTEIGVEQPLIVVKRERSSIACKMQSHQHALVVVNPWLRKS